MQQLKEALTEDMQDFLMESKWENHIKESVSELLEYKPDKPLLHLYEKSQLKQKLEPMAKPSIFINDLAFYASKIDPLVFSFAQCQTKLLCIIVEKHQQSKIKKFDALKASLIILSDISGNKEIKDVFFRKVQSQYEDILTVNKVADLILRTILVQRCLSELILIQELLDMKGQMLSTQSILAFLMSSTDNQSINRKMGVQSVVEKLPQEVKVNQFVLHKTIIDHILNVNII